MSYGKSGSSATPAPWRLTANFAVAALTVTFLMLCAYGTSDTAVLTIGLGLITFLGILTDLAVRRYFVASLRPTSRALSAMRA